MPNTLPALVASAMTLVSVNTSFAAEDMPTEEIVNGYRVNAALTQLHRWYLLYEEPQTDLANQLDLLTSDINLKSGLGEAKGHEDYRARVAQIPTDWKNAHLVNSTEFSFSDTGQITLTAEVGYVNQGILPEGAVRTAELAYSTTLLPTDGVLPKFSRIEISQKSEGTAETFVSAYAENRMRSLVHYWMALIEDPRRDPEPVREILADDFQLNFSSGPITDFDGFKAWLAGTGSQVKASTHKISSFSQEQLENGTYRIAMTFDWNGILPNDTELAAKTGHTWIVTDDPADRFPEIKMMDVEIIEPFAPKQ